MRVKPSLAVVMVLVSTGCSASGEQSVDVGPTDSGLLEGSRSDASAADGNTFDGGPVSCPAGPPGSENDAIKAVYHDGQTFVTWPDLASGEAGIDIRYNVYRALAPITETTLESAALVAKAVLNNSGKLFGTAFTEAERIDMTPATPPYSQPAGMSVITQDGGPLPPWTGLFVHTAVTDACAYYAVVATDLSGHPLQAVTPGQNATTAPVAEHMAPIQPIKLYDSTNRGVDDPETEITGKPGLSLQVVLHASEAGGGGAGEYGDYYVYYATQNMGYVDGLGGVFSVEENHSGPDYLVMRNRDAIVNPSGASAIETYWFGYQCVPDWAPNRVPLAYPFTEARLLWMIPQVITRYVVDPDRVTCMGGSMGAWGATSFCFHHPDLFAAVYPDRPRTRQTELPSLVASPTASSALMSDGKTTYLQRMDSVAFAAAHHEDLPFYAWDIGRQDGFAPWKDQVDMVAALTASHHGFAFLWNDGDHSGTVQIAAQIRAMYPPQMFSRATSYPAFGHSSIDNDLGDGSPDSGALSGGINLGFSWTAVVDQPHQWSATISNSVATAAMTVDVTPRNCQQFHLQPGDAVTWTASSGGSGSVQADAWGLATVSQLVIPAGGSTVLTLNH